MKHIKITFFLMSGILGFSQNNQDSAQDYQNDLKEYFQSNSSPLNKKEQKKFKGLDFFPISQEYIYKVLFVKLENQKPFVMPSTGNFKQKYIKYAELHWLVDGKKQILVAYQNLELSKKKDKEKRLFVPFIDATNGEETYGGGRYLDIEIPENNTLLLDFNKAYHPYCAYSERYSCPIVPIENSLNYKIKAGVKFKE